MRLDDKAMSVLSPLVGGYIGPILQRSDMESSTVQLISLDAYFSMTPLDGISGAVSATAWTAPAATSTQV